MSSTENQRHRIYPVLMSGGSGTRLWPLSRENYPKQLLPLLGDRTMLQDTAVRVGDRGRFEKPMVICSAEHRFIVAEQLQQIGMGWTALVLEPLGRNTAPAATVAALLIVEKDPDGVLLMLPADHSVRDPQGFHAAVERAARGIGNDHLATFGITPDRPETGYGYIRIGTSLTDGCFAVAEFVEKPDRPTAERFLQHGGYVFNSGMFLFSAKAYLEELERLDARMVAGCRQAISNGHQDLDFLRLDQDSFAALPDISIDYAVMERTDKAIVVPVDIGWSDVGAWSALWELGEKDEAGNVCIGDVIAKDSQRCYLRTDEMLLAVAGLEDVIVVVNEDAVLVAAKNRVQDVKAIVQDLKSANRPEAVSHQRIYRPWGYYQSLHSGERFQVKRITVKPGAQLSLQKHYHRAEHWVVVNGTALVTRGDESILLRENESVYLPLGINHRLANPGKLPLNLIEVQSGAYLGEDDIVRFEDDYGRG